MIDKQILNQKIEDLTFCCIDFETTGLNYNKDEIIEIGAIKCKNFKLCERFTTLIQPSQKIPIRVTKVTGINMDMLMDKPTIDEIRNDFLKFLEDCILVEHSRNLFDIKFLKYHFNLNKPCYYINTLELSRKLAPKIKKYNLISVAKVFDINIEIARHHKAIDDAKLTALLLIKLLRILKEKWDYKFSDLLRLQIIKCF